jgi:ABC-type branched-subunit amino acid transport system ATPase component
MTEAIVVEGLVKAFGSLVAVDGISFTVGEGSSSASSAPTAQARQQP